MTAHDAAVVLNNLLAKSPRAVAALVTFRAQCSPDAPGAESAGQFGWRTLGVLGVLNLVLDGPERLEVVLDEQRRFVVRFEARPR